MLPHIYPIRVDSVIVVVVVVSLSTAETRLVSKGNISFTSDGK